MKRNLIIDGQILQTGAWHRGMGKYMLQVLQELNDNPLPETEVTLLFNTYLEQDKLRLETIKFLLPNIEQLRHSLPLADGRATELKTKDYTHQLTSLIDEKFPDADNFYLLTSLFSFDFFAEFPDNCHRLVLFYDLTPLLFWRDLGGYFPPDLYMPRFQRLLEADQIFAISETTRQDLLVTFGLSPGSVTNINGGFTKIAEETKKPTGFNVPKNYVLFPTGDLPHKNNDVAVRGFERYAESADNEVTLLITSNFSDSSKERLSDISSNVIFTSNVTDEELEWLYENANAVLFASKYEGLGMPVLDAVASKKPIIASKIPVFEEMSKSAFYYFESTDADSLNVAFDRALSGANFKDKLTHYPNIMQKYTWNNTVDGVRKYLQHVEMSLSAKASATAKPKIAVACIGPGLPNQIGRLAESLHASLRDNFQVDYYFDGNGVHFRDLERPTFLDYVDCKVFDVPQLNINSYKKYETIIYLLDTAAMPSRVAQRACVLPGIAVVGDMTGLDVGQEMLKQAALDNQQTTHDFTSSSYDDCQKLVAAIQEDLSQKVPGAAENILRQHATNHSIIRKLKALVVL